MEIKWLCIGIMFMFMSTIIAIGTAKHQRQITERIRIQYDCIKKPIK